AGGLGRAGHSAGLVSSVVLHRFSETADALGRCVGPRIAANSVPRRTSSVSRPRGIGRVACRPRTSQGPLAATIHQALHNRCIMKTFALAWLPYALAWIPTEGKPV